MNEHERDEILTQIRVDVADIKARIEMLPDHESRIRILERFRYAVPGAAALAVAVAVSGLVLNLT
jgi:hypothetical protein